MEVLFTQKLENGYSLEVQYDKGGPLSVRLENSKKEFVGQIFASFDTLKASVIQYSNDTFSLSDEQYKKIKDQVVKIEGPSSKNESSKLTSLMNNYELVNKRLNKYVD